MKVSLLLHIYQPPIQDENVFRAITQQCYMPLIKLIKRRRNHVLTLNIPLSTLEQFERYGYQELLTDIRDLIAQERIEITSSAAYHTLLTKVPTEIAEEQMILNEYSLGYYFGSLKGFEGEDAVMIKDINGFFSPELAINMDSLRIINELGYKWAVADKYVIDTSSQQLNPSSSYLINVSNYDTKILVRDNVLSNYLAFKRDLNLDYLRKCISDLKFKDESIFLCMDAEVFGHHYDFGIYLLDSFLDLLESLGLNLTGTSSIIGEVTEYKADSIKESSWAMIEPSDNVYDIYNLWQAESNDNQHILWDLFRLTLENKPSADFVPDDNYLTSPIWNDAFIKSIEDIATASNLLNVILFHKSLNSDQFWWLSNKIVSGKTLFNKSMVENQLKIYKYLGELSKNPEYKEKVEELCKQIRI